MLRPVRIALLAAWMGIACARPAAGQITSLADDIILLSKGVQAQEAARSGTRLGSTIGGQQNTLGATPGGADSRLKGLSTPAPPSLYAGAPNPNVLSAISNEGQRVQVPERLPMVPREQSAAANVQLYGQLDVPLSEQEGPANGLTLDAAIERLVQNNIDLRTKAYEIPKSRADVLTASLRTNPLVFATASSIPYGSYSPQRPGENGYSATVIYPFDVSHKRLARTEVASRAGGVLEAQYQDAIRLEIDNLYTLYVDLVAARETLRYALVSQAGITAMADIMQRQLQNSLISRSDLEKFLVQRDLAELGLEQSQLALVQARQHLAMILNLPLADAERLEPRGTLRDSASAPSRDELRSLALGSRPDLIAYRLGVERAQSDVRLAEAEKYTDVFLLYSPWELRNNAPTGGQNATSWSVAAFGTVPIFNRNQGNIRRAQINVAQTQTELAGLERQIQAEVQRAYAEYATSGEVVAKIDRGLLPRSRQLRDISANLVKNGQASPADFLSAQKDYNEVVRQYRDALIRHRRAMLRLNTVVAKRIMP